jgi:hydroxyacylglutathione hydrolase
VQLTEHIYLVASGDMGFSLTHPLDCHVYLVDGGQEAALIDAGAGLGTEDVLAGIRATGLDVERVRWLHLTHPHADHAGGAAALREAMCGLQVTAAAEAAPWVSAADEQATSLDFARSAGFYPPDYKLQPCPVERELHEGDQIAVGEVTLQVIETPGHCAGHLCFLAEAGGRRVLFAGDHVFHRGRISIQNIPDCSLQAYARSTAKLAELEVDALLPGHLTLSLQRGQRHIASAHRAFQKLGVPPSVL